MDTTGDQIDAGSVLNDREISSNVSITHQYCVYYEPVMSPLSPSFSPLPVIFGESVWLHRTAAGNFTCVISRKYSFRYRIKGERFQI